MPRSSVSAIQDVIDTDLSSIQITAFLGDANAWVTANLASSGLTATILEKIEKYLACALIRLRDLGLSSGGFDGVTEQYQVDPKVTGYLHTAADFDTTGTIRETFMAPPERTRFRAYVGTGYASL